MAKRVDVIGLDEAAAIIEAAVRDAQRRAVDIMTARLREELAGGRAARRAYDLDLTATEVLPENRGLPPPKVAKKRGNL